MTDIFNLGDQAITTALTNEVITDGVSSAGVAQAFIDNLGRPTAMTVFANFTYGSGGTSAALVIQTSLDGTNWIDIARFDFTTASRAARANLSGLTPVVAATVAALGSEGQTDGILGDRFRAKLTTVGTYAGNTSIAVRIAPR